MCPAGAPQALLGTQADSKVYHVFGRCAEYHPNVPCLTQHKPLHAAKAKQFLREIDDEQILQLAMMADSAAIELELPLN